MAPCVGVLMVGAGEYNVGYVPTAHGAASDKPAGVVALTCFDLRRRGLVGRMVLCDCNGTRMPQVRATLQRKIRDVYRGLDLSLECFPADDVQDEPLAYERAMDSMSPGDVAIIFVPDHLHYPIAMAAVSRRLHVLLAKPAVHTLRQHRALSEAADRQGVLVSVEYHKRFDPMYSDARNRILAGLGPMVHFASFMSQPKQQLDTFRSWAGLSSDISYYLNSHHVDVCAWVAGRAARPLRVVAMAATGVAQQILGRPCEDTITLMVQWRNEASPGEAGGAGTGSSLATSLHTASWVAVKGDCHTQQGFSYMGARGEVRVDQAHRGYCAASEATGYASLNPLYMRYTPDASGQFAGQDGYGYVSIARFLEAAAQLNAGTTSVGSLRADSALALIQDGAEVTAILEAGRVSLDCGMPVDVEYDEQGRPCALLPASGAAAAQEEEAPGIHS